MQVLERLFICAGLAAFFFHVTRSNTSESAEVAHQVQRAVLAQQAREILDVNCAYCHSVGSLNTEATDMMDFVLDRQALIDMEVVIPGKADDSILYVKMRDREMPPEGEEPVPSGADVALIERWIDAGAPGWSSAGSNPYVSLVTLERAEDACRWIWKVEASAKKFTLVQEVGGEESSRAALDGDSAFIEVRLRSKPGGYEFTWAIGASLEKPAGSKSESAATNIEDLDGLIEYALSNLRFDADPVELMTIRTRVDTQGKPIESAMRTLWLQVEDR